MQCPKCQTEVADMHYFCPLCHASMSDYLSEDSGNRRRLIRQVGSHIVTLLLLAFIVGASVFVARAINWKELVEGVKEAANPGSVEKENRKTRNPAPPARKRKSRPEPVKSPEKSVESGVSQEKKASQ